MIDSERFKLLYGPYRPPRCQVGDKLPCEYRGWEVVVGGLSDGLIQWPYARKAGQQSLIVCGDLIRAVRVESEIAVAHHWGVRPGTVGKWRRALGVPAMTSGSRRLRIEYAAETLTPEVRAIARAAMHSPTVRAKLSAIRAGRPAHPNTIAAARETLRRPKTEAWKRGQSERSRQMWAHREEYGLPPLHPWSAEEIALLGTARDAVIAQVLGLSRHAVGEKRRSLGIPGFRPSRSWSQQENALLGTASDRAVAQQLGRTLPAVRSQREKLGIPAFPFRTTRDSYQFSLGEVV